VGPFSVFDARIAVKEDLLDLAALARTRAGRARLSAAQLSYADTQELVVLVAGSLYVRAVAEESRVDAAKSHVEAARALHRLAVDRKDAGTVPAIDVLRAEVELKTREQGLIDATNAAAKAKLDLMRAIGLPLGQEVELVDRVPYSKVPPLTLDAALDMAGKNRRDVRAAEERVRASEESLRAAKDEHLPRLALNGDYGGIGQTIGTARGTFAVAAGVEVPIFTGGRTSARVVEAEAALARDRAALADLKERAAYDVRSALLDLAAADERVRVATEAERLAREELVQAEDRFRAGVSTNLDVIQAEESVAVAADARIGSVFAHNIARAALARALGVAGQAFPAAAKETKDR